MESLAKSLQALGVQVQVDNTLVRGLDYYNDTCFEIHLSSAPQDTLVGGGRYDSLGSLIQAGVTLPAVGCAGGLERIVSLMPEA